MSKEVKVGDKVVSLVNWIYTKEGNIYTVERISKDIGGVWLEETNNFLSNKEFRVIESVDNMNEEVKVGDKVKSLIDKHTTKKDEIYTVGLVDRVSPHGIWLKETQEYLRMSDFEITKETKITSEPLDTGLIDKQEHYTANGIQPIDLMRQNFTQEAFKGFLEGNILKYVLRHKRKNGVEDLRKAMTYLTWLIEEEENE